MAWLSDAARTPANLRLTVYVQTTLWNVRELVVIIIMSHCQQASNEPRSASPQRILRALLGCAPKLRADRQYSTDLGCCGDGSVQGSWFQAALPTT